MDFYEQKYAFFGSIVFMYALRHHTHDVPYISDVIGRWRFQTGFRHSMQSISGSYFLCLPHQMGFGCGHFLKNPIEYEKLTLKIIIIIFMTCFGLRQFLDDFYERCVADAGAAAAAGWARFVK